MIEAADQLPYLTQQAYWLGVKAAADEVASYSLSGLLYVSSFDGKPYGLLSAPNAMVRGVFDAISDPGVELPLNDGMLTAHITVFRPEEIELLGGPEALRNDRGKPFVYTLGRLVKFAPENWAGVAAVYALKVHSPALQALRRSYGLSSLPNHGKYEFHVTVGVRRKGVLGRSATAKDTTAA